MMLLPRVVFLASEMLKHTCSADIHCHQKLTEKLTVTAFTKCHQPGGM